MNTIEINLNHVLNAPLDQKMNMKNIISLGVFLTSQKENKTIYLDDVALKK